MRIFNHLLIFTGLLFLVGSAHAITVGQIDDFETGTTMGWREGSQSPNPPVNVADGGPVGAGDNYLQNESSGVGQAGSRQAMFNDEQWSGNYLAAGVTGIQAQMANFGDSTLSMRIALGDESDRSGTWYGSNSAVLLPADGIWRTSSGARR